MFAGIGSNSPVDVCLTVDFEPDCPPYLRSWRGVEEGAPRLLELFAAEGIQATFFATGETAERYPEAIRAIVEAGHELGCHGMTHRPFRHLSRAAARAEIQDSLVSLRRFGSVTSFRAPYLQFPDVFLNLLEEAGIWLDSSQAKYKLDYFVSRPLCHMQRIPASVTSSVLRLPKYLRNPWLSALASPVVLFVHPWEFVDLTRESIRLDCRFRTGAPALNDLRAVIGMFRARRARFWTMQALQADGVRIRDRASQAVN